MIVRLRLLLSLTVTIISASACVHPIPAATSWRLSNNVLIPPGVSMPTVRQQTVTADAASKPICPQGVRSRHNEVYVKVTADSLSNREPGWLTAWAQDLEAQGCIAPGEAFRLAIRMAQSLPLETNAAFRLVYPRDPNVVAIDPGVRLQVMTPIMAEGTAPDAPIIEATATVSGNTVNINGRFTENLLGYEMTWYAAQARNRLSGVTVAPLSTERHINGGIERASQPILNYFQPLNAASFYGLFYKGGQTEFTALIVGGVTKADLNRRTKLLETGIASCEMLNNELCVTVPKRAAINPMVAVTVNGEEKLLNWGATVGAAIRAAGIQQLDSVLPQLSILKPYGDRTAAVEFNHSDSSIFNLIVMGGEKISWN
jgi:hypothetical protein